MVIIFKFSDENIQKSQLHSGAITDVVEKLAGSKVLIGTNNEVKAYFLKIKKC
jgi:hypothetical protein